MVKKTETERRTHATLLQTFNVSTAGGRGSADNTPLMRDNQPMLINARVDNIFSNILSYIYCI